MARHSTRKGWRKLTRRDLAQFDDYAVKAIQHAMDRGGVGKISTRGHVMIKAPDGRIMGVAADTRKSRQVIAIALRDLFGDDTMEQENAAEIAASVSTALKRTNEVGAAVAGHLTTDPTLECPEPSCESVFVTEGARYTHIHRDHHVCPHPGCMFTRNHRGHVLAHTRTAHAEPGSHPRSQWAARKRAAKQATEEAPKRTRKPQTTNHKTVEPPHGERAREHAQPETAGVGTAELTEAIRRIDKYLGERHGLEERIVRLEAENAELRAKLAAVHRILDPS